MGSQRADGWFGPRELLTSLKGKPDLWPHMVMCNVLQSFYEFTGDERVIPFLTKYFKWLNTQPNANLGAGYWPKIRFGDNIETLYWLYNRTGSAYLLDLARQLSLRVHLLPPWTDIDTYDNLRMFLNLPRPAPQPGWRW